MKKYIKTINLLFLIPKLIGVLAEVYDYLSQRNKLKKDDGVLSSDDKNELRPEIQDIYESIIKLT